MMRTEAPKEREGRGLVNLARTTPELPIMSICQSLAVLPTHVVVHLEEAPRKACGVLYTVRAGDLAPDDADLGAANLLLGLVDKRDLLAEVEAVTCSSEPARPIIPFIVCRAQ